MKHDPSLHDEDEVAFHRVVKKRILGALQLALVILALVAGFAGNAILSRSSTSDETRTIQDGTIAVEVVEPRVIDLPFRIEKSGTIQARNTVSLSPQVAGRVVSVSPNLASGGTFRAGEELFRLDDQEYTSELSAESEL
ncbi:MAG: hypothetical protein AAFZ91_10930 [Pseudomonadota bacterium]